MSFKSPYRMFPWRRASIDTALGNIPTCYLLRDEFTTALAAGAVNGTAAEPGPGTRTVVDTGNHFSISAENLTSDGGLVGPDWLDPSLRYGAVVRVAGKFMLHHLRVPDVANQIMVGLNNAVGGTHVNNEAGTRFSVTNIQSEDFKSVGTCAALTDYYLVSALRATGYFLLVKGGIYINWTLLWYHEIGNTATLYPKYHGYDADFSSDYMRVPCDLWLPEPVASDGFNAPNGTSLDAHLTDGLGHPEGVAGGLGSGGAGLAWTERTGNFDIQTNRGNISVASGGRDVSTVPLADADILADVTIRKTDANDNGEFGLCLRYSDDNNFWMVHGDLAANQIEIVERNGGVENLRASAAIALTTGTDYDVRAIAYGQTVDAYLDGANKATYAVAALNETATVHGIVGDGIAQTFDDFVVYPRGTGGEYAILDDY